MITKKSTVGMSREEWLKERRKSLGGSDAAACLGLSKYASPYSLWGDKTGKAIPEDISDKEAVRLGNDLEEYVAQRFSEATGKKVRRMNAVLRNTDFPFAHADIDRAIVGEKAGLECKTTSSYEILDQCERGEFPDQWYCQMTHYMMVTGWERWYLAVLVFGRGFYWFKIERDEDEISALALQEAVFWTYVVDETPPPVDGSESTISALQTIFREDNSETVDLGAVATHLEIYGRLQNQIKELEATADEHKAAVMEFMGESSKGVYGNCTVTWKTQNRRTFDKKAFEADFGAIPDKYYKESTSRPLKFNFK